MNNVQVLDKCQRTIIVNAVKVSSRDSGLVEYCHLTAAYIIGQAISFALTRMRPTGGAVF